MVEDCLLISDAVLPCEVLSVHCSTIQLLGRILVSKMND